MNKKYMVKRNAHGQAVVVSELAKSKGKLSSVAKVVGLAILGLSSSAFAETTNEITTYGQGATAQTGGTAVGVNAKADTNGTAIGQQATASNNATANGYVSAALANDTIAIGVNSGAVGDGLGKETFTHLKEIDQKITEYSKETPPVDPLKAVAPTLRPVEGSILANPFKETSGYVWSLGSDGVFEQVTFILGNVNSFDINEQIRNDASSVYKNFYEPIKDQLKFNTEEKMRAVTLDSMKALYQSFVDSKSSTVNDFTSEYVTNIQTKLAEYENQNSALYEALLTVYQTKNPNSLTETQAQLIVDNEALSVEITKLLTQKEYGEYYSKELDRVTNYSLNSFHDDRGEKPYDETVAINMYNQIEAALTSYDTALAEYNAKVAAYDEAVKTREITEAERVVKLEEAIKELNDKATELGLGDGYTSLSQVLGSLEGRAIAIGNQAYVSGNEAVGVGYGNTVTGSRSNVVGTHNNVTTANNNVMGNDNTVTVSEGNVLVGNNITFAQGVTTSDNIALGSNTVISAPFPTTSVDIQGATYSFAGKNPTSVLSIGSEGNERQIQNVAAGRVTKTSTDAINGSQLYAVVEAVNALQAINFDGIFAADTNTQYAVSAKLGKGLKVDENGAIAATAQPINGGSGVSITTNAQDEAVVNVAGVMTTTDDGKSYARSDLTKAVDIKGDGKNIRTSTAANGDVQVQLADEIQVKNIVIQNGPVINQQGIDAVGTRITHVQDGVAPTDAVNVRQLTQQGNIINQRIDNLADHVKKNKKRTDAGIASTAAMTNIPQVLLAGQSGIGVGIGHRDGQSAIAVGYSRASENAKHSVKFSVGMDTQSKATLGAGYMYNW